MSTLTIRGNTTAEVELRYTQGGRAVGNVTVAVNRGKDDRKATDFYRVTLWEGLAENATSLPKGTSVIVHGRLESREYETKEGRKVTAWDLIADSFGPDLRFQTVTVSRTGQGAAQRPNAPARDPWPTQAVPEPQADAWAGNDETPF